ncbi:biotin transporter BioY [Pseudaestuariivita atlantica]|uniref:Biotin transporter n=1 Tax=Pseudaestuariivita atlantica TaxID=1317121 RepID=A0A0L1JKY8_9RHOB|nr:biotin transporter BioY [Pseudaestuariivita atlantica]KNG92416.1 acetyl-COA carboxylase [Pseudaestuariivita atlantica]
MTNNMTLGRAMIGSDALWTKIALVVGGSLLVALAAQVSIPMWPVPISMQTLAVLMVGFVLGSRLGAAALALYLAEGAMGLPVFAGGKAGMAWLFAGPTTGFLFGFVLMAFIAGLAGDRGQRSLLPLVLTGLVAAVALYIPGVLWPMSLAGAFGVEAGWVGTSAAKLWAGWVSPFILGDVVKAVLAALLVAGGWSLAKR